MKQTTENKNPTKKAFQLLTLLILIPFSSYENFSNKSTVPKALKQTKFVQLVAIRNDFNEKLAQVRSCQPRSV